MKSFLAYLKAFVFAFFVILPTAAFAKNADIATCKNTVLPAMNLTEQDARHVRIGTPVTYLGHTVNLNGTTLRTIWGACAELTSDMPAIVHSTVTAPPPVLKVEHAGSKPAAPLARPDLAQPARIAAPAPRVMTHAPAQPNAPHIMSMKDLGTAQSASALTAPAPSVQPPTPIAAKAVPATPAKRAVLSPIMKPTHTVPAANPKENTETRYDVLQQQAREHQALLARQKRDHQVQAFKGWISTMGSNFTEGFAPVIGFFKHWYVWGTILSLPEIVALFFLGRRVIKALRERIATATPRAAPERATGRVLTQTDVINETNFPGSTSQNGHLMRDAHADSRSFVEVEPPEDVCDKPLPGFSAWSDDTPINAPADDAMFELEPVGGVQ